MFVGIRRPDAVNGRSGDTQEFKMREGDNARGWLRTALVWLVVFVCVAVGTSLSEVSFAQQEATPALLSVWVLLFVVTTTLISPRPYAIQSDTDIREDMRRRLPGSLLQRYLTWAVGKPHRLQKELWKKTWIWHLSTALLCVFGGVLMGIAGAAILWLHPVFCLTAAFPVTLFWFIAAATFTVGGARKCLATLLHEAVHLRLTGSPRLDRWIGQALSTIFLLLHFDGYQQDHCRTHHKLRYLATKHDPDAAFLLAMGFRPGMTRKQLWRRLIFTCCAPRYHWLFFTSRLKANFWSATTPTLRLLSAWAFHGAILASVGWACWFWASWFPILALILAWFLPMTVVYQQSALLQFGSEHRWLVHRDTTDSAKATLAKLTTGRFLADALPPASMSGLAWLWAWTWWWIRLVFLHLPCRIGVICSDLPAHDWHHRFEGSWKWVDALFARQRDVERADPSWPQYTEIWGGLPGAIDLVFSGLEEMPPDSESDTALSRDGLENGLHGM